MLIPRKKYISIDIDQKKRLSYEYQRDLSCESIHILPDYRKKILL